MQPELLDAKPVIIHPAPAGVVYQHIYVHVPSGHEKKWSKYCAKYNACGRPVYFVRDRSCNEVYVPEYYERHSKEHGGGHEKGHGKGHNYAHEKDDHKHGNGHD